MVSGAIPERNLVAESDAKPVGSVGKSCLPTVPGVGGVSKGKDCEE